MCICVFLAVSVLDCVWDGNHAGNSCQRETEKLCSQIGLIETISIKRTVNLKGELEDEDGQCYILRKS